MLIWSFVLVSCRSKSCQHIFLQWQNLGNCFQELKLPSKVTSIIVYGKKYKYYEFNFFFREIRTTLCGDVKKLKEQHEGFLPALTIIQVGGREDSNVYIRMKMKAAEEIGIKASHVVLPSSTTQVEVF